MGASPRPSLALIAAGAAAAGLAPAGGCYDLYTPDCGFYCSADGACPDGYTCSAADHRCRRDGSEPTLACPGPDGFVDRAPVVVFTMPRADAIGVPERSVITVAFSKPVDNVTGSTFVVELGASPVAGVVDFAPGDTVATFIPAAPFELATPYHARLDRAIHDFRGLPLIPYDWTFTTGVDSTPPRLIDVSPPAGATDVSVFPQVIARFSEPVVGVSHLTFTLERQGGGAVPSSVDPLSASEYRLTPQALAGDTSYVARLAAEITDVAGNPLAGAPIAWGFTTDATPPQVTATDPAADATGVPVDALVEVTFTEPVQGVSATTFIVRHGAEPIAGTRAPGANGAIWRFLPNADLPAGAAITVELGGMISDLAHNSLTPYVFGFTTAP